MEIFSDYIDTGADIMGMFNHTALEALLRAIEDDIEFVGNRRTDLIDIRAKDAVESVYELRDMIRRDEFMLDLNKIKPTSDNPLVSYVTPYDRKVRRAWSTNHYMVETDKGWVVFDCVVEVQVSN
ncbi:hypothetical protein D9M68_20400 [compost metagenome]